MADEKRPVCTVQLMDFEVKRPTRSDVLRAAYARGIDDDERGDIRVKALQLCWDILQWEDQRNTVSFGTEGTK